MAETDERREYLIKSIKFLREKIKDSKEDIQTLDFLIRKEKQKLPSTGISHAELWFLRDKLKYVTAEHKKYKIILNAHQKELSNIDKIIDSSKLPDKDTHIGEFFKWLIDFSEKLNFT